MHIHAEAIILAIRAHGEHGAVVRALTADHGVQPGYVRGGRSRRLRPVLQPGNEVLAEWRARSDEQLAALTAEPLRQPRCAPCRAVARRRDRVDDRAHRHGTAGSAALSTAPRRARRAVVRNRGGAGGAWLGRGAGALRTAAAGRTRLRPRSGPLRREWHRARSRLCLAPHRGAVSRGAAAGHEARLLPLPAFLRDGGAASWAEIVEGLAVTGRFLARDVLVERRADTLAARERLVDRLKRAVA